MSTFRITNMDKEKGHVSVVYSVDGLEQTMGDAPIKDEELLKAFLNDYGNRYEASLALEEAQKPEAAVEAKINDLVGETFEISDDSV